MEVPLMDSGILINPSFLRRLLSDLNSIWTYGALLLAAVSAFSRLIKRTSLVILRFPSGKSVLPCPPTYFSDADDVSSSSDEESDDDDEDGTQSQHEDEEERVVDLGNYAENEGRGGKTNEMAFLPELSCGGAVVKVWDGLGLGFRTSGASGLVSLLDLSRGALIRSFPGGRTQIPAVFMESPAVILSAAAERAGTLVVRAWDARAGGVIPAALTEWAPLRRLNVAEIAGGDVKVLVGDDAGEVSVVDLRNGAAVEAWWDTDAVFVGGYGSEEEEEEEEEETGKAGGGGGSVVSCCRNAVRCFPVLPSSM